MNERPSGDGWLLSFMGHARGKSGDVESVGAFVRICMQPCPGNHYFLGKLNQQAVNMDMYKKYKKLQRSQLILLQNFQIKFHFRERSG